MLLVDPAVAALVRHRFLLLLGLLVLPLLLLLLELLLILDAVLLLLLAVVRWLLEGAVLILVEQLPVVGVEEEEECMVGALALVIAAAD